MSTSASDGSSRDDFPIAIKRDLAHRVNSKCSRCNASTSGPQASAEGSINIGVAAHITAASEGGARYDRSLSASERRSAANGIWLCQNCAKLVDNDALQFPATVLLDLKSRAERRAQESIGIPGELLGTFGAFTLPNTHRRNPFFLANVAIESALAALEPGDTLVLRGLGGAGKTQYAVQYAHSHRERYRHVLWASASTLNQLHESLAALTESALLGIDVDPKTPTSVKIDALSEWLGSEPSPSLLVIDGADSDQVAREIRRVLPSGHRSHVLITSRLTDWPLAFRSQSVEAWDPQQAAMFLETRVPHTQYDTKDVLVGLGTDLGGLPLALEQAAAYIVRVQISVEAYRRLLGTHYRELLAQHHRGQTEYPTSVWTTWLVTIDRLTMLARNLLSLLACFSSEPIPRSLVSNLANRPLWAGDASTVGPESKALDEALAELSLYSLITLSLDSVRVHPLLQAVVRNTLPRVPWRDRLFRRQRGIPPPPIWARAIWPLRAAALLTADDVLPWPDVGDVGLFAMRTYAPHLDAVLGTLPSEVSNYIAPLRLRSIEKHYREQLESYQQGANSLRSALEANIQRVPNLRYETDWLLSNLEALYERAVAVPNNKVTFKLRALTRDTPSPWDVYDVLRSLAEGLVASGDVASGRRIYRLCWDHATADPTADSVHRARARIGEALATTSADQYDLTLIEEGLELFAAQGRLANGDALEALCIYVIHAKSQRQRTLALKWLTQSMDRIREMLAWNISLPYVAASDYIELLNEAGRCEEALLESKRLLQLTARPTKPRGRGYRGSLWRARGRLLATQGEFTEAAKCYAHAYVLERNHLSLSPLSEAGRLHDLGKAQLDAGRVETARLTFKKATEKLRAGWEGDSEHAEILAALMGVSMGRAGESDEGQAVIELAMSRRRSRVGSASSTLATIQRLYGILLHESGRLAAAETELRSALKLARSSRQDDSSEASEVSLCSAALDAALEAQRQHREETEET